MDIYFSDYFRVSPLKIERYGAFNISLILDMPLFVDPFLLFNSSRAEYRELHDKMIKYLKFLKDKSSEGTLNPGLIKEWYTFREVKQNWLGYSIDGNKGRGLGIEFANTLNKNLDKIFRDFGKEKITKGSHLEKLCLIDSGVGKDGISDFTVNLIQEFLLNYTQKFALKNLDRKLLKEFSARKVNFNYHTESWESKTFILPKYKKDYVLLTPKDILTKDEPWINKIDLLNDFDSISPTITNENLRALVNNYFTKEIRRISENENKEPNKKQRAEAALNTLMQYPVVVDYYIKIKEDSGDEAVDLSKENVIYTNTIFVDNVKNFIDVTLNRTDFYSLSFKTYDETKRRLEFFKHLIENKGGYKLFYYKGNAIKREKDLQILFQFVWYGTELDVNREVETGIGNVDYKISFGAKDKSLVEMKLASNPQLKRNLKKQLELYKKSEKTKLGFKVILYFSDDEYNKVIKILTDLKLSHDESIILIDGRKKKSASKV